MQLISNLRIIYAVPHWPHFGIAFDVNRRAGQIRVLKRNKPQPLPNSLDDDGKVCQGDYEPEAWKELHDGLRQEAANAIQSDITVNPQIIEHG